MSTPLTPSGNRPLEHLKVAELRDELRKRGLSLKGVKKELFDRLEEAIRNEDQACTPLGEPGTSAYLPRVSSKETHGIAESEGEDEETDKSRRGVPFPPQENQCDTTNLECQDMANLVKETSSRTSKLDQTLDNMEPQKGLGSVENAVNDGIVSDVVVYVSSSMTDPVAGAGAQACLDHAAGSSDASVMPIEHPGVVMEGLEIVKEEAECHTLTEIKSSVPPLDLVKGREAPPDVDMSEASNVENRGGKLEESGSFAEQGDTNINPATQTSEVMEGPEASQDVYISEASDFEKRDAKLEDLEINLNQAVESQVRPGPLGGPIVEEKPCFPVLSKTVFVKAESGDRELQVETRQAFIDSMKMEHTDFKDKSLMPAEVYDKHMSKEIEDEKPRLDSMRSQKIWEEEQNRPEGRAGGYSKEWTKDTKEVDMKYIDGDSQLHSGQKRKDHGSDKVIKQQEPAKRQRRWNSGNNLLGELSKPLTTDTVKEIIHPENKEVSSAVDITTKASLSSPKILATSRPTPPAIKVEGSANGENGRQRIVPPPTRPATTSLKIERFIRPFTLKAVKDLLSGYGSFNDFWMDQIKTHCYVTFSSLDEAVAARNALYNKQWPPSFGNLLVVEFVDPAEVKTRCEGLLEKAAPFATPRMFPTQSPTLAALPLPPLHGQTVTLPLPPPPPPPPPPVRDRSAIPPKKEPDPPIPTLDDLFKKTKAKPHIYYLPLTDEQVAAKLAAKNQQILKSNASALKA